MKFLLQCVVQKTPTTRVISVMRVNPAYVRFINSCPPPRGSHEDIMGCEEQLPLRTLILDPDSTSRTASEVKIANESVHDEI